MSPSTSRTRKEELQLLPSLAAPASLTCLFLLLFLHPRPPPPPLYSETLLLGFCGMGQKVEWWVVPWALSTYACEKPLPGV